MMPKSLIISCVFFFFKTIFLCVLFVLPTRLHAQPVVLKQDTAMFWAGGFNAPQVQMMDLNADSRQDLVIFDRTASRFFTFLSVPTKNNKLIFCYAPIYEQIFPPTQGWFLLRDYNRDGLKDFFAHAPSGMQARQARRTAQGIEFVPSVGEIFTKGLGGQVNLQIAVTDIPCLHDIDGDGDLDAVVFDFAQGNYLELHLNTSPTHDGLRFERQGYCWGNLWEGFNCGEIRLDYPCEGGGEPSDRGEATVHAGSSLTLADLNQDNRLDLLVGDVSCKRLYAIYNKGTNLKPVFARIDTLFPAAKPVDMLFPAVFVEDVTHDGLPDLLVAPNVFQNEGGVDFERALWLYEGKKKGKKLAYSYQTDAFLQAQMLDVGENASPALWDYDQDGDFDLFVGNRGAKKRASLHLWENIGTKNIPDFRLKTADFEGFSNKQYIDIQPFTADINQDGRQELHILAYEGRKRVWRYLEQGATTWLSAPFSLEIGEFPVLFDFDGDKDLDILVTATARKWRYFERVGGTDSLTWRETSPAVEILPNTHPFGGIFPIISDINNDGKPDFLVGKEGRLTLFSDVSAQWRAAQQRKTAWEGDNALFFDSISAQFITRDLGNYHYPACADLDGDGRVDILVGLRTGGVALFWNRATP